MYSPFASARALFRASDWPRSGSERQTTEGAARRSSTVPSEEPPSMTTCCTPDGATLASAVGRKPPLWYVGVSTEMDTALSADTEGPPIRRLIACLPAGRVCQRDTPPHPVSGTLLPPPSQESPWTGPCHRGPPLHSAGAPTPGRGRHGGTDHAAGRDGLPAPRPRRRGTGSPVARRACGSAALAPGQHLQHLADPLGCGLRRHPSRRGRQSARRQARRLGTG